MKDAKNMDSVFSNCTDDELMFDILFDDDETIIEALAGSDVMSKLLTEGLLEEGDDMVGENPDFDYQNDGDASYSEKDAEGTKEVKPEVGGEVGDGKEVSGKENSAEANAHDDKDEAEAIGLNDKQQVKLEDAGEGPLEDDDQAEREGEVSDTAVNTEASTIDALLAMLDEAEDPISDGNCPDDCDKREGKDTGVSDTEGKDAEVIGAANAGSASGDPIADPKCPNDGDVRAGADTGVKDTEGVKSHVVGAALESGEEPEEGDAGKDEEVEEAMTLPDELLSMLEADEEEPEEGAPEEPTDEKSCKEGAEEEVDKPEDAPEQSTGKKCCNEADDYLDSLLKYIDDEDEDLIAAIDGGAAVVPDGVKTNGTDNSDIKEAADKITDELIDDQDDKDIEAIEGEDIPAEDTNIDYDYDDDELIDAVINGLNI